MNEMHLATPDFYKDKNGYLTKTCYNDNVTISNILFKGDENNNIKTLLNLWRFKKGYVEQDLLLTKEEDNDFALRLVTKHISEDSNINVMRVVDITLIIKVNDASDYSEMKRHIKSFTGSGFKPIYLPSRLIYSSKFKRNIFSRIAAL